MWEGVYEQYFVGGSKMTMKKMTGWLRAFFSPVLVAAVCFLAGKAESASVQAADGPEPAKYEAVTTSSGIQEYSMRPYGVTDTVGEVVYCVNHGRKSADPGENTHSYYVKHQLDAENIGALTNNSPYAPQELYNKMQKAILAGYPSDQLGIKGGALDIDFRWATQLVVWHLADGINMSTYGHPEQVSLANSIMARLDEVRVPDSGTLFLYENKVNVGEFQNFITASFSEPEKPKPERPADTTVRFSKRDVADNELAGARIELQSESGEKQEWTSDGTVKEFTVGEGKYTFTETATPDDSRYAIASVIRFSVVYNEEENRLEITDVDLGDGNRRLADGTMVMVDAYVREPEEPKPEEPKPEEPKPEEPKPEKPKVEKPKPVRETDSHRAAPKTGDHIHVGRSAAVTATLAITLGAVLLIRRRRR